MDAIDQLGRLYKAAPPFPPKKKGKGEDKDAESKGGDCPPDDADGDGVDEDGASETDETFGEGDEASEGEEGDDGFAPDEGDDGFPPEGDEGFGPDDDMGGGVDPQTADLVEQLAAAEKDFYAAKGMHGPDHHKAELAMEVFHKLVRKLAKQVHPNVGKEQEQPMDDGGGAPPFGQKQQPQQGGDGDAAFGGAPFGEQGGRPGGYSSGDGEQGPDYEGGEDNEEKSGPPDEVIKQAKKAGMSWDAIDEMVKAWPSFEKAEMLERSVADDMRAKMEEPSMNNFTGDPMGGKFIDWSGLVGHMHEAGDKGEPSEAAAPPGPPFGKMHAKRAEFGRVMGGRGEQKKRTSPKADIHHATHTTQQTLGRGAQAVGQSAGRAARAGIGVARQAYEGAREGFAGQMTNGMDYAALGAKMRGEREQPPGPPFGKMGGGPRPVTTPTDLHAKQYSDRADVRSARAGVVRGLARQSAARETARTAQPRQSLPARGIQSVREAINRSPKREGRRVAPRTAMEHAAGRGAWAPPPKKEPTIGHGRMSAHMSIEPAHGLDYAYLGAKMRTDPGPKRVSYDRTFPLTGKITSPKRPHHDPGGRTRQLPQTPQHGTVRDVTPPRQDYNHPPPARHAGQAGPKRVHGGGSGASTRNRVERRVGAYTAGRESGAAHMSARMSAEPQGHEYAALGAKMRRG